MVFSAPPTPELLLLELLLELLLLLPLLLLAGGAWRLLASRMARPCPGRADHGAALRGVKQL